MTDKKRYLSPSTASALLPLLLPLRFEVRLHQPRLPKANSPAMRSLILLPALMQPRCSLDMDVVPPSTRIFIFFIVVIFTLGLAYILYPAYSNADGGLGCKEYTLTGDVKLEGGKI